MNLKPSWEAALYLEKGHLFEGIGFGSDKARGGEAVFNTGMSGYQEIITDPSYSNQVVVMTSTQVGNTGINFEDLESKGLYLHGLVAREYFHQPSSWRSKTSLSQYLAEAGVPGISDIDTRELTRILRDEGAQRCVIFPALGLSHDERIAKGKKLLEQVPDMNGLELVSMNSCQEPYEFGLDRPASEKALGTVVVYDFGVKTNILRSFADRKFRVKVVPYSMPHQEVLKEKPVAVVLSNGPGDPAKVPTAPEEISKLISKVPLFAICMGHQLLARALGGETFKMKFGHHGLNHPVKDMNSGRVLITSQNHGFSVKAESLRDPQTKITMLNLNDGTVEGFASEKHRFSSVQFHPEAKPGPSDADYLFDQFIRGFIR